MDTHLLKLGVVLCVALFAGAAAFAMGPVPAEMAGWQIVSHPEATQAEHYAAEEFQALFSEMTGLSLPLVAEASPDAAGQVFIGPDAVAAAGGEPVPEALGKEGLRIRVTEDAIHIDGGRPRGTLYGVYEFFEEHFGARFLTHDHTHFPEDAATQALSLGAHSFTPPFAFRWSFYGETRSHRAFSVRLRTNTLRDNPKLGGRTGIRLVMHNTALLVPPAVYGESNPEYFALVDGQRKLDAHGGGPQLCMTNPDLLDIVVEAVRKDIEANPSARSFSVAHMDNRFYCTCEDCAAVDAREESHAGSTLAFVNAVAEEIEKTHPDVLIATYAYEYTRKPPKNIRARRNVLIQLCSIEACNLHAINDPACAVNRDFTADMDGWKEKAEHITIWHYNTNFRGYLLPYPNLRSIGPSVDYYNEHNTRGVFMQAAGNAMSAELSDLRNYVMSRCLWKPGRDSWAEAEEFVRLHYAESAQPLLDYLHYYHDLVEEAGMHPTCFPTESGLAIHPESARRIWAYFEEALSLAESEVVRDRVEKASLTAYRAVLSAAEMRLRYEDGVIRPDLSGLEPDFLEQFVSIAERHGMTQESETQSFADYAAQVRRLHAGLPAVRLENDTWRVVLLPESNAKLVEMTHKPSGRNVIEAPRSFNRFRFEEWARQGEGPKPEEILAFAAEAEPDQVTLSLRTPDGSTLERRIALRGEAVHFETRLRANAPRVADMHVHPEYFTATSSDDPNVLAIYLRQDGWVHANAEWKHAQPTSFQTDFLRDGASGGAYAFYNHEAGFGVEQRFDPAEIATLGTFWSPSRLQVNLELYPRIVELDAGEATRYAYEIRYLSQPPAPGE